MDCQADAQVTLVWIQMQLEACKTVASDFGLAAGFPRGPVSSTYKVGPKTIVCFL